MSQRIKECIKETKEMILEVKNANLKEMKSLKLCKLIFELTENEKYERKSETRNIGRLRGFRAPSITLSSISWKEFLELENQKDLIYPIENIEENLEEIKKWLCNQDAKQIKICKSNKLIEDSIDRSEYEKSKSFLESINKKMETIKSKALMIEEDEYDDYPEEAEEFLSLTEEFYNIWKAQINDN